MIRYDDIDDVIARANDTNMGLGGSVWSSSIDRAYEYAKRVDSGTVWINHHTPFAAHPVRRRRGAASASNSRRTACPNMPRKP